jgi:hypothetical protein
MESILTWLTNLITNSLLIIGFLLVSVAAIFKDEKSVQAGKTKETVNPFSKESTLRPLPNWLYLTLNLLGVIFIAVGALQLGGVIAIPSSESVPILDQSSRRIESFPTKVFAFSGAYDSNVGQGRGFLDVEFRSEGEFAYHFSFDLPSDGTYGYAGFTFFFINPNNASLLNPQDLTDFNSIQITLQFEGKLHQCELFIKDIAYVEGEESKHANYVTLRNEAPPNGNLEVNGNRYKFTIPLSNFDRVDLRTVREVGFLADTNTPQDELSFTVREILFTR